MCLCVRWRGKKKTADSSWKDASVSFQNNTWALIPKCKMLMHHGILKNCRWGAGHNISSKISLNFHYLDENIFFNTTNVSNDTQDKVLIFQDSLYLYLLWEPHLIPKSTQWLKICTIWTIYSRKKELRQTKIKLLNLIKLTQEIIPSWQDKFLFSWKPEH